MKLDKVTQEFLDTHRADCSNVPITFRQKAFYLLVATALLALLSYRWDYFLFTVTVIMSLCYFGAALFRCAATLISLAGNSEKKVSAETLNHIKDADLPVYTILLPLYKEANIAGKIIKSMNQLDYPADKLDIKLLLESDDTATIAAVNQARLPDCYEVIIVPDSQPKTKPRACNYGLKKAKGKFCVIFDAEDRPDPDQLKKVVSVFENAPENLACVQAKLNYYNARQNLLTRLFTIEYSTTFDLLLPGLEKMNVPVPLGGTSNHFRTEILQNIGGWDPFNVTEDCDLGIRIYKRGYRTALVDSTTWEEANSMFWNWVRQRSRWVKGFIQTHFTHMRHPLRTIKDLGLWGMAGFYMCVGASSFMMLVNVFYWLAGTIYLGLLAHGLKYGISLTDLIVGPHNFSSYHGLEIMGMRVEVWPLFYMGPTESPFWSNLSIVFFIVSAILMSANFIFILSHVIACFKRKYYNLVPYCLLMPAYWVMISLGAWKGFIQFFTNPFYWEKTIHGLDTEEEMEAVPQTATARNIVYNTNEAPLED